MSVTAPNDPAVVLNATVPPEAVRLLLPASFNWTVIVEVVAPSAVMEAGAAMIVLVAVEAAPTVKSTVALSVMAARSSVPVMVAVPAVVLDVSVAV